MHKEKLRLRILGSIFVAIFLVCTVECQAAVRSTSTKEKRADILEIDTLKLFGGLERGAVIFLHDKHTVALEKTGKDCSVCHLKETGSDRQSLRFKRLEDKDKKAVMDNYHGNCIACHDQFMSSGQKSGPVVCAGCHNKEDWTESDRKPMGFDNSLHARHEKALEKKCETCHHVYDDSTKALIYAKGKESTCRYCHKEITEEKRVSMRLASHASCVDCHQRLMAQKKNGGPVQCGGCHDSKEQIKIERATSIPRMEMKQPDVLFIKTGMKLEDETQAVRMSRVPFNHKGHETYSDNCRACHHASLSACGECHTFPGKKEGDGVTLEDAMHQKSSQSSCVGCHALQKISPECAGCHQTISPTRRVSDATCKDCHLPSMEEKTMLPKDPEVAAQLAGSLLEKRRAIQGSLDEKDIPDVVTIKALTQKYKPVELPHRRIVQKLISGIKENKLAAYFHEDPTTVCQGCHHNTPSAKKPPQCSSCHGAPFDSRNPFMPGLMAAYHQQCMGCHDEMGIQKPASRDCIACHKEK